MSHWNKRQWHESMTRYTHGSLPLIEDCGVEGWQFGRKLFHEPCRRRIQLTVLVSRLSGGSTRPSTRSGCSSSWRGRRTTTAIRSTSLLRALLLQSVQMVNTPTTHSCCSSFRCHVLPCGTSTSARLFLRRLTLIGFLLTCADGRSCSHVHRLAAGPVRQHSVDYTGQARCAANCTSTTSTDKNIRTRTRVCLLYICIKSSGRKVVIGTFYHPLRSLYKDAELERVTETILAEHDNILVILAGDFNQLSDSVLVQLGYASVFYGATDMGHFLDRIYASDILPYQ